MQIILVYYSTKIRYFEIRTQSVGEMATFERIDMLRQLIKMFQRANFSENIPHSGEMLIFSEAHCTVSI